MDDGATPITDAAVLAAVRTQARVVQTRAAATAVLLTAIFIAVS